MNKAKEDRGKIIIIILAGIFVALIIRAGLKTNRINRNFNTYKQSGDFDNYQEVTNEELLGTWAEINPKNGNQYIKFLNENNLELGDNDGSTKLEYETIRDLEPNQLYIYIQTEEGKRRMAFGIFKIQENILLWRDSIEIEGSKNFKFPTDFSVDTISFEKINSNQ